MEINQIISCVNHYLHICNSSNQEEVMSPYLIDSDAFVTKNIKEWQKRFGENGINCPIKLPREVKPYMKIVVDGASLGRDFKKWEKKWEKQSRAVCIYNIDKLSQKTVKDLVSAHSKMLLSLNKVNLFTVKALEKDIKTLNPEIVEDLVKKELKNIVMSLLLSEPMCGTELVRVLYKKFKVLVLPGKLYPTLKELEKKGLLKYEYKLKNKIYTVQKKEDVTELLKNHVKANSLLSQFLATN